MSKSVILTGLRSNSEFHLGNYLGGIKPMVDLQRAHAGKHQLNMFVPDLHSFTTPVDHQRLYNQTIQNLKLYIAAGLDINNADTFIYRQSYIPAHSELTVILNNFTYFGELSRMTQFKEKSEDAKDQNITVGLFDYPVLMAADILLYGAQWVPVGDDQKQHLELTRDIAIRFNNKFGDVFTPPHEWNKQMDFISRDKGARIKSLRNPDKKMSKSVEDPSGTIMLSDSPEVAAKKIMSATTDSVGTINYDWNNQPGVTNLLQILALTTDAQEADVAKQWGGSTNYGDLKKATAESVSKLLEDLQTRLADVDEQSVFDKLHADEMVMQKTADETLAKVQRAVGLRSIS